MFTAFKGTDSEIRLALTTGAGKVPFSTEDFTRVRVVTKDANGNIVDEIDSDGQSPIPDNFFQWDITQENVKGVDVFVLQMFLGRYTQLHVGTFDAFLFVYDELADDGIVWKEFKLKVVGF